MRFCQNHWNMLRENVDKQGLTNWVAPDGETALMQIADEIAKGKITQTNYDPLMSCHNMIIARTVEMVGLSAMSEEFGCPICFFNTKRTEDGRCACVDPACGGSEPGSIPPFEIWLEQTPAACKEYMEAQGWL
jgi:hypothetical protein